MKFFSKVYPLTAAIVVAFFTISQTAVAGDWPMWRYDSKRGASTPDALPADLQHHWSIQLPDAMTAWPPEQTKLQFDLQAYAVVAGQKLFVTSSKNDSLTAIDTRTGAELWRFTADGPVRFSPVAEGGKVFIVSDDGFLYALAQEDGRILWKKRGGPSDRPILGNDRLISSWPARGGPVLHEERLYFAASIWPFMGVFVHALDPETGEVIWTNSGFGSQFTVQPHSAPSFASLAPQGHLAAADGHLIVAGGRSVPGVFDLATGDLQHFEYDKRLGGHEVGAAGGSYYCAGHAYRLSDGAILSGGAPALVDDQFQYSADRASILARSLKPNIVKKTGKDRRGNPTESEEWNYPTAYRIPLTDMAPGKWFLKAGSRLFSGGSGKLAAYDLPKTVDKAKPAPLRTAWQAEIEGTPWSMLAGDDRLFVITQEGQLHCFADGPPRSGGAPAPPRFQGPPAATGGYAVKFGLSSGVGRSDPQLDGRHIIHVLPDQPSVDGLRHALQKNHLYGTRSTVRQGTPTTANLPPYFADTILFEKTPAPEEQEAAFRSLRPYGGKMLFKDTGKEIIREGALPGTADWTHQYANATQTVVAQDEHVKAPFGVLWFGGPSHEGILPRHGHGPSPQVAGGRLFIEGVDKLRAVDVYTGRLLWEKNLPGFGDYYNRTDHFAGAGEIGTNYVSLEDSVYAVYGPNILELDSTSGETRAAYPTGNESSWGFCLVAGDYLVGAAEPLGAVAAKSSSAQNASALKADGVAIAAVVPEGAEWDYLAGADPDTDTWKRPAADLGGNWKTGPAGFGFSDGDDATEIPDMKGKFTRLYIRRSFDSSAVPENAAGLRLRVLFDDGFVAYLNGTEVARSHVTGTGAKAKAASHEAEKFESFNIRDWKTLLRDGENVLAIEGHNLSKDSSDLSLHPILEATISNKPTKVVAPEIEVAASSRDAFPVPGGGLPDSELTAARFASGSKTIVVFKRSTGEFLWSHEAKFNFRHNNLCSDGRRLFAVDSLTASRADALRRRGLKPEGEQRLMCFDLETGNETWSTSENVFGTFLSYSAEHDFVIQSGSKYRDRASDEIGKGMSALHAGDGSVAWHQPELAYGGPLMIYPDRILTNGAGGFAIDIETGIPTGWKYARHYGCNTAVGSTHLLTFRSGAAGFFDLFGDSGTGNLGGFRSSCTNNLIPANGILNAPDYTRTCSCAYQNQASLALINMPENEFWTFGASAHPNRLAINFGAPGDRRSADGSLFVDYPSTGGSSPDPEITLTGTPKYYRRHASILGDDPHAWLGASGVAGITGVKVKLPEAAAKAKSGTVRIYLPPSKTPQRDLLAQSKAVPVEQLGAGSQTRVVELPDTDLSSGSLTLALPENFPLSAVEVIW